MSDSATPWTAWPQKLAYGFVLTGGRMLKRLMWWWLRRKPPHKRLHPKHRYLPDAAHRWYLSDLPTGGRVLDLGCGAGGHVRALIDAGVDVVGVERDFTSLATAYRHDRVQYVQADLEAPLPLADGLFDAVLALDVIEHLHGRDAFLREVLRVLGPGGYVFLSAPNRATRWKTTARRLGLFKVSDPDHKIEYTQDQLRDELRGAGLEVVRIDPVVFDTPWDAWIDFLGVVAPGLYCRAWKWKRDRALADRSQSTGFRVVAAPAADNDRSRP